MNIAIVEKAYRFCKRRITSTQKGGYLTRMVRDTGKGCSFNIDASVPTACWSFNSAKNRHEIKCGLSLDGIANADTNASEKRQKEFVQAVIRHETEHGRLTDRTNSVGDECKTSGIPFRLWNLFEDCRIEYASATRVNGDGAFRWVRWQDVDTSYNVASSLLWAIKTNEAGIKKSSSAYVPDWTGSATVIYKGAEKKTRLVVLDFYRRAISAVDSMALIPLCKEWIDIFGKEIPKELPDDMINGEIDPNAEHDMDTTAPTSADNDCSSERYERWVSKYRPMNADQISRISRAMASVVQSARLVKNKLATVGTRLHAASAMQGSERSFLTRGRANGRRKVTLILDTSGSMASAYAVHGGKEFVLAFRDMHRKGLIDLNLILTQVRWDGIDHAVSRLITNQDDKWLNGLCMNGDGEGVMQCIKRFLPLIKKSTTSVIFTDSCLSDKDIDTQTYRNMGLNMIASYIEPNDAYVSAGRTRMNKHFARSVIATNATELATRLMREILKD